MTAKELIESLGGYAVVAQRLKVESFNVRQYTYRGKIPVKFWPKIIELARERDVPDVDAHLLMTLWIGGR